MWVTWHHRRKSRGMEQSRFVKQFETINLFCLPAARTGFIKNHRYRLHCQQIEGICQITCSVVTTYSKHIFVGPSLHRDLRSKTFKNISRSRNRLTVTNTLSVGWARTVGGCTSHLRWCPYLFQVTSHFCWWHGESWRPVKPFNFCWLVHFSMIAKSTTKVSA